jgi:hypothetical protein
VPPLASRDQPEVLETFSKHTVWSELSKHRHSTANRVGSGAFECWGVKTFFEKDIHAHFRLALARAGAVYKGANMRFWSVHGTTTIGHTISLQPHF